MTAPIDIDCPTCKSTAGNYCMNPWFGEGLAFHHAARVDTAARQAASSFTFDARARTELRDLSKALDIAISAKIEADDQIAKLSADLTEAAGKIEELNNAKKTFHEAHDAAWNRGFALALISIWECQHDEQLIKQLLVANNFTPASFGGIGLATEHLEIIRKAANR